MPKRKITEENVKEGLKQGKSIQEIAFIYGVVPYTVHLLLKKIQSKAEFNKKSDSYSSRVLRKIYSSQPKFFELEVGNIIEAIEPDIILNKISQYVVIAIYEHIYVCEKITGPKWRTSFRKLDYKQPYDPHKVKLIERRR